MKVVGHRAVHAWAVLHEAREGDQGEQDVAGLNWSALALEGYGSKRHQSDISEADGGEADGSDKEAGERQVHRR